MIANVTELRVAIRQLWILQAALTALRDELSATNPELLRITEKAYMHRIEDLEKDIAQANSLQRI